MKLISFLPFFLCYTLAADISRRTAFDNLSMQRYEIWANLTFQHVSDIPCDSAFFAVPDQCKQMKQTSPDQMNVYSAEAGKHRKLMAVLPDGTLSRSGTHDGIVVIDPFPIASYGHLVIVFFVDRLDRYMCELARGIYIENHNDCLLLALKDGCHNVLTREKHFQNDVQHHATRRLHRCQIDFLPYVYEVASNNAMINPRKTSPLDDQKLQCREAKGFARCPNGSSLSNSISRARSTSQELITPHIHCRMLESCDHAVIIHGSWGRLTSRKGDFGLLMSTKRMLNENGFPDANVKLFYKNGMVDDDLSQDESSQRWRQGENMTNLSLYPASEKEILRSHIRSICSKSGCIDSLVIFLKGPAIHNGSLLLFDVDEDGLTSDDEKYTVDEILSDLANCLSKRLYVIADYSYSGRLTSALKHHSSNSAYSNQVVVTSGNGEQYSWNNQFTTTWINANHRSNCFKNTFQLNKDLISYSNPTIFHKPTSDNEEAGATLFGAPCTSYPHLSDDELRARYLGCNKVPSWLWFQTMFTNSTTRSISSIRNRSQARRK